MDGMTDTPPRSPRNDEGPREKAWAAAYNDDGPAFEAAFDAALAEERRHVIEQIKDAIEREPTLAEVQTYGLDGSPGTNFNTLQLRLDLIRALVDDLSVDSSTSTPEQER